MSPADDVKVNMGLTKEQKTGLRCKFCSTMQVNMAKYHVGEHG